ncbi:MAG TPA: GntR family transcriptional regulator [Streptomyces sp.]|uniref:GntR family transcriptional regulator n=1 Tax=Streptomyces sp. TaxID=1931 RepID=UPI002C893408|nr:GntR family transcriptional regulator [Streptomyces sp.]HWU07521.1 GntR family transcriptional regulator [Streptomyces sp.]
MPAIERSLPPYMQVIAHIRAQIEAGELRPGDMVPSDRDLAKEWGISRVTAQKVLTALKAEGLAESVPGVGTRVCENAPKMHHTGRDRASAVRRTGKIYTPGEYARIVSAELVPAPADVATALSIEAGAPAIKRVRVTYNKEDQPVSASTSWYDGELAEAAPRLLEAERIPEGSWTYLEKRTGRHAVYGCDSLDTRLATEEDAALLGLTLPAALKESTTTLKDGENVVVEFGISISQSGRRSVYEYELDN